MRAVIQRVSEASVTVEDHTVASIGGGLLILLGIEEADEEADAGWLAAKIARMRILEDGERRINRSLVETGGEALVVSQFTLHASTRKGNRPSFTRAARPEIAIPLYEQFIATLERALGQAVATGEFGASMRVALVNEGPVTITIDSKNRE